MQGEYTHSIDAKGRLFIPSRLRDELGGVVYVTVSIDNCLWAYSSEKWQQFSERVDSMPLMDQHKIRPIFANAAKCELDSQGRILIPQKLRDFVKLDKNVTIVGCNSHAELWNADSWLVVQEKELDLSSLQAAYKELGL